MGPRRWAPVPALAALLLIAGAGAVAAQAAGGGAPAGGRERVITITARQFRFDPGVIEVNKGDRVVLKVRSVDVTHGFYLDGYGIKEELWPFQEKTITFVADRPGRFMFRCAVTCGTFHPYMIGWLRVKPNVYFSAGAAGAVLMAGGFVLLLLARARRMTPDVERV